ncbi:MAG: hypothetical protein GXY33_01625 [Phycisphaerae bacterium]|nr:hypothetical protein [Phycisphaerae bacterium]
MAVQQQFEPMSVGQILDRTFKMYRANFLPFIAIVAVVYIPIGLIQGIAQAMLQSSVPMQTVPYEDYQYEEEGFDEDGFEQDGAREPGEAAMMLGQTTPEGFEQFERLRFQQEPSVGMALGGAVLMLITVFLIVVGYNLCTGALIKAVSEFYLGRDVTVGQVYRAVWPRLGTIIWAAILVAVAVMFGFALLIVPGVIFALWFALTTQVVVLEDKKATAAMSRSRQLASGNLGKVFGVGFLAMVITWVISIAFGVPAALITGFDGTPSAAQTLVAQLIQTAGQIVALPIVTGALILLYYDLRIRKEGFDLEMLAQSLQTHEAR